ncbi:MAG TPA: EscU/YscU/HrcU family type III secretion system export apparatus switch protein, partial [Thermodesulfobacteriota bacterium]|nr:EscU/YscU/HrcU family type III secretion system export apparatus switch protein [Thermodesulfobacteriota bacterium]
MPDFEERTEQATPRRREKAREKGSIPRSRELVSMVTSGGAIVVFYFAGKTFMDGSLDLVRDLLGFQYGNDPLTVMKLAFPKLMLILTPFW